MTQQKSPDEGEAAPTPGPAEETRNELFGEIARKHLMIPTLKTRSSDRLDFHEVAVWNVESALNAAYDAGRQDYKDLTKRLQKLGFGNLLIAVTSLEEEVNKGS